MNKIYRLIWNKNLGAMVAVGEHTAARGKKSSGRGTVKSAVVGFVTSAAMMSGAAQAYVAGTGANSPDANAVAIGTNAYAGPALATAVGGVGTGNTAINGKTTSAVSIGNAASAASITVAIGDHATTTGSWATALGQYAYANTGGSAFGTAAYANGHDSVAFGYASESDGFRSTAIGVSALAVGDRSAAIGHGSNASAADSMSFGDASYAGANYAIAIGSNASAQTANSVAIGGGAVGSAASVTGANGTAIGIGATTSAQGGIALGYNSSATIAGGVEGLDPKTGLASTNTNNVWKSTQGALSVGGGSNNDTRQITNVAAGINTTDAVNVAQLQAMQTHYYSVNDNGTAGANYNNDGASATGAVAAGIGATAKATNAVAMGNGATASIAGGVALGAGSQAAVDKGVKGYVPGGTKASAADQAAVANTIATNAAVDVGSRQITSVAAGTNNGDAVNVSQLKAVEDLAGAGWNVTDATGGTSHTANIGPKGAVTFSSADKNMTVTAGGAQDAGTVQMQLADNLDLTKNGSVTMGTTVLNANGLDIKSTSAVPSAPDVSITAAGISAGMNKVTNVADGVNANDAVNVEQLNSATTHYYSVNDKGVTGGNYKNDGATGNNALAAGVNASAAGLMATAVGASTNAQGDSSVATGAYAAASGAKSVAVGNLSAASGMNGVAIGSQSSSTGAYAAAFGQGASAGVMNGLALGAGADASTQVGDVALGAGSATGQVVRTSSATVGDTTYDGFAGINPTSTVSVGTMGNERTITNVAAGQITSSSTDAINGSQLYAVAKQTSDLSDRTVKYDLATDGSVNYNSVSMTGDAYDSTTKSGGTRIANVAAGVNGGDAVNVDQLDAATTHFYSVNSSDATAANYKNDGATGVNAIAAGVGASASADHSVAMGELASATTANSVALGANSSTSDVVKTTDMTIGKKTYTFAGGAPVGTVSVGSKGNERTITNVAAGQVSDSSTDAINGSQLYAVTSDMEASKTHYYSVNDNGVQGANYDNDGAKGIDSLAAGVGASATGFAAQAVGYNAVASGDNSAAFGQSAKASGPVSVAMGAYSQATNNEAVAIGAFAKAAGNGATALGVQADAEGDQSFAVGNGATSTGAYSNAQGYGATAGTLGSVAIGPFANASANNGDVALGMSSKTSTVVNTTSATVGDTTYTGFAGTNAKSTVSVGSAGNERTITNVAAGQITDTSTDAINGSQLFAVAKQTSDLSDRAVKYDLNPNDTVNYNSVTMGGDAYDSTTKAGGTRISNVAAGVDGGDAVNVDQLKTTVDAAKTRYYSVNDNDVQGANYNNDGATGVNALAAGVNASATADGGVALGSDAVASTAAGVAGYVPKGASDDNTAAIKATMGTRGAVSVGDASHGIFRQINGVAAGTADSDAVNVAQLNAVAQTTSDLSDRAVKYDLKADGSVNYDTSTLAGDVSTDGGKTGGTKITNLSQGDVNATSTDAINGAQLYAIAGNTTNEYTNEYGVGVKYVRTNDNGLPESDAFAQGQGSTAVGYNATTSANAMNSVAMGNSANAGGSGSIAIGASATTKGIEGIAIGQGASASVASAVMGWGANGGALATAVGAQASAAGYQSTALGNGATASDDDSVALGANSSTSAAVGTDSATIGNTTYTGFAGTKPVGTVSVGSAGNERTITNVAAGQITKDSTDAINGSQLYSVAQQTSDLSDRAVKYDLNADGSVNYGSSTLAGDKSTDGGKTGGTKITNLAQGDVSETSTDAINGSQLYAIAGDTSDTYVTKNGRGIRYVRTNDTNLPLADSYATGQGSTAVGYNATSAGANALALGNGATASDDNSVALGAGSSTSAAVGTDSVTIGKTTYTGFAGTSPVGTVSVGSKGNERTITNVAAGQITSSSTDAINGSQLYAVAQQTSDLSDRAVKYDLNADGTVNYGTSTLGGDVSTDGGKTGGTKITNLSQGDVSATSTDAINGAQLYAIAGDTSNTYITDNGVGVKYVRTNDAGLAPSDSSAQGQGSTAVGYNATSIGDSSVAMGRNSKATVADGIALGSNSVASTAAGVAGWDAKTGQASTDTSATWKSTLGALSVGDAANGQTRQINGVAAGSSDTDAVNVAQLKEVAQATSDLSDRAVKYDLKSDGSVDYGTSTLAGTVSTDGGKTGGTKITNLSQGDVSEDSTDAVNGSQLYAIAGDTSDTYVTKNGRGIRYVRTNDTGLAVADSHALGQASTAVGYNATATGNGSVAIGQNAQANNANDVAIGSGSTTSAAKGTPGATIAGDYYGFAGTNPTSTVSVGSQGQERTITNVAAGQLSADSTDAVNGSQLYATNQAVDKINTTVNNIAGDITNITQGQAGMFQTSTDQKAPSPSPTGTNSAAGGSNAVASGSNSLAVGNGSQATADNSTALGTSAKASASNSVAIGANSVADRANSVSVGSAGAERQVTNVAAGTQGTDAVNVSQLKAAQAGSVQYDTNVDGSTNYNSVTLNPGGSSTTIHNVQAGSATTDAVNVGQLSDAINNTQNWAKNYTDNQINQMGKKAYAGTASALAAANLPQAYQPNQSSAGVGIGTYQGQTAISIGVSTISESGRYIFKASATGSQQGGVGVGVGAGMVW